MAATLIQPASANNFEPGSLPSSSGAYANNVTAGSLLICPFASSSANAFQTVKDNINGNWQLAAQASNSNSTSGIFYMQNANPGATTVTCSWQGTAGAMRFALQEWGGFTSVPLDRNGVITASTGSTLTPATGLTTYATQYLNSVVISMISGASGSPTITAGGGATLDFQTIGRFGVEYQILSAQAQVSGAFNYATADFAAIAVATFIVSPANISLAFIS
jgi:hypothetical protein